MQSPGPDHLITTTHDVEIARYRIARGERALRLQIYDGRLALVDVAADHNDRHYIVERGISSQHELTSLAREYAQRSQALGLPAILATMRAADL